MNELFMLEEPFCINLASLPNGGKGNASDYLKKVIGEEKSISVLPMGDMIREASSRGEIPPSTSERSKLGYLVPNRIVIPLVKKALAQSVEQGGNLIVEGLPRNIGQAKYLIPKLLRLYKTVIQVHLLTPLEECERRRAERYEKLHRPDDLPGSFARRVQVYLKYTYPAIVLTEKMGVRTYRIPIGWDSPRKDAQQRIMMDTPIWTVMQMKG